jgi:hypothetical protein
MGWKKPWLLLVIVGLILVACTQKTTPVAPLPVEATPTPKPVEVPPVSTIKPVEATPTLNQVAALGLQPGAAFSGPIKISGKASGGTISFAISEDGTSITLEITLSDLKCDGMSASSMSTQASGPLSITDYSFNASFSDLGEVEGRFASTTEASGTIDLSLKISVLGQTTACELGTWDWSAEAH